ncbi:MAG: hypothetical protein IH605_06510 [Burkholderiales bacterium]|nr:hypothetical protein [Burkholderiales bacterium]
MEIHITKCDNALTLVAWPQSDDVQYEICTILSGNNFPVDVRIPISAGEYRSGIPLNGVGAPLKGSYPASLPAGGYTLAVAGINWGGPWNFSFTLNGQKYDSNNASGNGVVWLGGDGIKPPASAITFQVPPSPPFAVPPLNDKEKVLVDKINSTWNKKMALDKLRRHLQAAVEVELATIPIYLYSYYSIQRTVGDSSKAADFPYTRQSRWADKAGALIMSVAVEEMLHMSLSSNILFALGQMPVLFGNSPKVYPASLPGHSPDGPDGGRATIDLAPFSEAHLRQFLLIEYPAPAGAEPEGENWQTIGQIYSYIRCIISSKWISDSDFNGNRKYQIQSGNYSPNSIDTVYPDDCFDKNTPAPAEQPGSASKVAKYASRGDSHVGSAQLIQISSCQEAMEAIATIDFEGEGFDHTRFDDPSQGERSHYWKFLTLQAHLAGYSKTGPDIAPSPPPPDPVTPAITSDDLKGVVFNFPKNPTTASPVPAGNTGYTGDFNRDIADLCSALYTYMLIMTETLFKVPDPQQKLFFNQTLHMSMIWMLDKFCQAMRQVYLNAPDTPTPIKTKTDPNPPTPPGILNPQPDEHPRLAPTFQNYPFASRAKAWSEMVELATTIDTKYKGQARYDSDIGYYVGKITGYVNNSGVRVGPALPDVRQYWAS